MQKTVGLLLGAGASYEAGMPLVWELTAELKNWLTPEKFKEFNASWREQGEGVPGLVENDFVNALSREDMHYENLLGYLETQHSRYGYPGQPYHHLYVWLIQIVYFILYNRHLNNCDFIDRKLKFYEGLSTLVDQNTTLRVFSLNHDLIVELAAQHFKIPLFSGFGPSRMTFPCIDQQGRNSGEFDAEVLLGVDLEAGKLHYPNPPKRGIYLLKLHGALDQFAINDGKDFVRLCPTVESTDELINVLRRANEDLNYFHNGNLDQKFNALNEITYTDQDGVAQFLRRSILSGAHKFDDTTAQVVPKSMMKIFEQNLKLTNHLVCVGYGFGDLHINLVLRDWLEASASRTIEVVSPDATDVPEFLLHVAPQVTVTPSGAFDYFDSIAGVVRSSAEQREKAVSEKMRGRDRETLGSIFQEVMDDIVKSSTKRIVDRVAELPLKEGKPDFSGVDIKRFVEKTLQQSDLSEEAFFQRLLAKIDE